MRKQGCKESRKAAGMCSSAFGDWNVLLSYDKLAECVSFEAFLVSEDRRPRTEPLPHCSYGMEVSGVETIRAKHSPSSLEMVQQSVLDQVKRVL